MPARSRKRRRLWRVVPVALAVLAAPLASKAETDGPLRVYVVTIDGLHPDEVGALMPNVAALREEGTWYEQARAVFPAETLPNHVAMMTGVLPEESGIIGNQFWTPHWVEGERRHRYYMEAPYLIESETLVTRLERGCDPFGGINTATVQSKTYLDGVFRGEPANPSDPANQRVADFHWAPSPVIPQSNHAPDPFTMEAFREWDAAQPADVPRFAFVNLGDVDRSGHADQSGISGEISAFRQAAMEATDALVGDFVADLKAEGAWDETVLIVNSDHSMDWGPQSNRVDIDAHLGDRGFKLSNGNGDGKSTDFLAIGGGGSGLVYVNHPRDMAPIARALSEHPGVDFVATREPVPGLSRNPTLEDLGIDHPNSPDIEIFVKPGWHVDTIQHNNPLPGNHGHPMTQHSTLMVAGGHEALRGSGASIAGEKVYDPASKLFSPPDEGPGNLSVAPTVARLFGVGEPVGGYAVPPLGEAFDDATAPNLGVCGLAHKPKPLNPDQIPSASHPSGPALLTPGIEVLSADLDEMRYEVTVTNRGGSSAQQGVVTLPVPASYALSGAQPPASGEAACVAGAPAGTACWWDLGSMEPGASQKVRVSYRWAVAGPNATAVPRLSATAQASGVPTASSHDSSVGLASVPLAEDTFVDAADRANTSHGACNELRLRGDGSSTAFADYDPAIPTSSGSLYPPRPDLRIVDAHLTASVTSTTFSGSRPGVVQVRAVDDHDYDAGAGTCQGSAASGREARAGAAPAVAPPVLDTATVAGTGDLTWDVTPAVDETSERFAFNGFHLSVADSEAQDSVVLRGGVQAGDQAAPRLRYVTLSHPSPICVDADPEDTTAGTGEEVRLDVLVTHGVRVSNGETDACTGPPVSGHRVDWLVEAQGLDVRFFDTMGLAYPMEVLGGGQAGPDLLSSVTDDEGTAFITVVPSDPVALGSVRVAAKGTDSGYLDEEENPTTCQVNSITTQSEYCTGEGDTEDDVRLSWAGP